MDLFLSTIIDELRGLELDCSLSTEDDPPLKDLRILPDGGPYDDSLLYIMAAGQLAASPDKAYPRNLVVVGSPCPGFDNLKGSSILTVESTLSTQYFFSLIQGIFKSYQDWHLLLQNTIIRNSDIGEVLDVAADKLHNPIAIFDSSGSLIHYSGSFSSDASDSIWEAVFSRGYSIDVHTYEEWKELSSKMGRLDEPFLYGISKNPNRTLMTCPLKSKGKLIAAMGMTSINAPISEGQLKIVSFLKGIMEDALANLSMRGLIDESNPYYVECLLKNVYVEERIVTHYLKRRGWGMNDSYVLLNITYPLKSNGQESITHPYIGIVEKHFPTGLLCLYEDSVIVILNTAKSQLSGDVLAETMKVLHSNLMLQCGVSMEFYHFTDLRHYYIQSVSALLIGRRQTPHLAIYRFIDFYKASIVSLLDTVTSLKSLCHPRVMQMLRSKNDSRRVLIPTLYAFLLNGRNIAKTASTLHVHRNTLLYRLEKLSEQLETDFESMSMDTQVSLLMSCIITEYM